MNRHILACTLIYFLAFHAFAQIPATGGHRPEETTQTDSVSKTDPIEIRRAFFSAFYQKGEKLPVSLIQEVVADNPAAAREMQLARRNYLGAIAVNTAGSFLVAFPLASALVGRRADWQLLALGAGLLGTGIPMSKAYFRHAERAAAMHNQSLSKSGPRGRYLQLGWAGPGVGACYNF
jgi:hypothetical protein